MGRFKNTYELLNPRVLKISMLYKNCTFQCMGKIFSHTHTTTPTPRQNVLHFADDIFKCIFSNEKFCISFQISLKFVPKDPMDDKSALVQVMAWCRRGNKPLPETMRTQFTKDYLIPMSLCLSHHWFIQEFTILLETSHQLNWWWFVCRNWGMNFHGILTKAALINHDNVYKIVSRNS